MPPGEIQIAVYSAIIIAILWFIYQRSLRSEARAHQEELSARDQAHATALANALADQQEAHRKEIQARDSLIEDLQCQVQSTCDELQIERSEKKKGRYAYDAFVRHWDDGMEFYGQAQFYSAFIEAFEGDPEMAAQVREIREWRDVGKQQRMTLSGSQFDGLALISGALQGRAEVLSMSDDPVWPMLVRQIWRKFDTAALLRKSKSIRRRWHRRYGGGGRYSGGGPPHDLDLSFDDDGDDSDPTPSPSL